MELEQLKEKIQTAGVVGAGGAGFPTHQKLVRGIDTVLVNAAECEPLLYTDCVILQRQMDEVVSGAQALCDAMDAQQALICMKQHAADDLGFEHGAELGGSVRVAVMPDVYPMGDEIIMIYQVLGRVVPPGQLPSTVGVVVVNVETAYNIWGAMHDIPVTQKWLTLGGDVPKPSVVRVPVNTTVKAVLDGAGLIIPPGSVVIDGGPAMGTVINPLTARITKKTKGLLILPDSIPAVLFKTAQVERLLKRTPSACCQCTFCTDLCPRQLLGYPLTPHITLRAVGGNSMGKPEDLLSASLCSGCGVCTLMACCQGIAPSVTMAEVKRSLGKNRLAYRAAAPTLPNPEREWRMVPVSRMTNRIGVAPYDRRAQWAGDLSISQKTYRMLLSQHTGKPSLPVVQRGDRVMAGQLIAKADEGISAALHTPITGTVTGITQAEIQIETGEVR